MLEHVDERGYLLDGLDLRQRNDEALGEPAGIPNERREEDVERPQAPPMQLGCQWLDPQTDERRERVRAHRLRDLTRTRGGVTILLRVGSHTVPVFVIKAEILDGLALELVGHAGVDGMREVNVAFAIRGETDRFGE